MMRRLRLRLRRYPWAFYTISLILAFGCASLVGVISGGYQLTHTEQVILCLVPIADSFLVWLMARETSGYRALVTSLLKEPVRPAETGVLARQDGRAPPA